MAREIGACFVPCAFVTAGFNDYMDRNRQKLLQEDVLPNLSMTASRVALETAARLTANPVCSCHGLKSPQTQERSSRV